MKKRFLSGLIDLTDGEIMQMASHRSLRVSQSPYSTDSRGNLSKYSRNRAWASVQAAIDAASAGEIVRVCPGVYEEQITTKDGVILYLEDGVTLTYGDGYNGTIHHGDGKSFAIFGRGIIQGTSGISCMESPCAELIVRAKAVKKINNEDGSAVGWVGGGVLDLECDYFGTPDGINTVYAIPVWAEWCGAATIRIKARRIEALNAGAARDFFFLKSEAVVGVHIEFDEMIARGGGGGVHVQGNLVDTVLVGRKMYSADGTRALIEKSGGSLTCYVKEIAGGGSAWDHALVYIGSFEGSGGGSCRFVGTKIAALDSAAVMIDGDSGDSILFQDCELESANNKEAIVLVNVGSGTTDLSVYNTTLRPDGTATAAISADAPITIDAAHNRSPVPVCGANVSNALTVAFNVGDGNGDGNLRSANDLSDLAHPDIARTNLGLGSAATQDSTTFDLAGLAAAAQNAAQSYADAGKLAKSSNLSDVTNVAAARSNLGLGSAAVKNESYFLGLAMAIG